MLCIAARQSHIKNLIYMTLWLMYAKKPTKICGKNLAKICDKNPLKICDKNLYITKTFFTFNFQTHQKTFYDYKIYISK